MSNFDHFIGTREVTGSHAFDITALGAYLSQHLEGFQGPLTAQIFKGGQSNPTYKLITPGRAYVMRTKPGPVAKLLPSAHAVEREFKVMQGLAGTDVPAPRMHCLCEDESVIGRAFFIMEFVEGRVLWDQSLPGMTKAERADIYDEMNRVISALHRVPFAARGLADYGKPGNYFERQIGRWSKQYSASITQPIDEMDRLMAWLPAHVPAAAMDPAWSAPRPNMPMALTVVSAAVARSRLPAAARSRDAFRPPALIVAALMPPLASSSMACAASPALNIVSAPILRA